MSYLRYEQTPHLIRLWGAYGVKTTLWLLSLPLFLVLYRNTASPSPQGEEKRDDDYEGNLEDERVDRDDDVEDKILEDALNREDRIGDDDLEYETFIERGDRDGDGEEQIVEGALNREDKIGDDDLEFEDGRVDGEDKRNNVEGELVKAHNFSKELRTKQFFLSPA